MKRLTDPGRWELWRAAPSTAPVAELCGRLLLGADDVRVLAASSA
jgi:hypothetical protein